MGSGDVICSMTESEDILRQKKLSAIERESGNV